MHGSLAPSLPRSLAPWLTCGTPQRPEATVPPLAARRPWSCSAPPPRCSHAHAFTHPTSARASERSRTSEGGRQKEREGSEDRI
eukprot:2070951-Rhodomonas_salina.1